MNDYYGELCTQIYESDKSFADGKELEFYLSFVKDKNMKVLEPMCGNGRMLLPFLQRGIDIEGFDISDEMLKVCKEKGKKLNLNPLVTIGKIEEFQSPNKYDLIIIPFGSFSLLPDHLVADSLANMKSMLTEDGKLLLTIMTNRGKFNDLPEWRETNRKQYDIGDIVEYKQEHYDSDSKILKIKLKYQLVKDEQLEKTELMDFPIRLYELGEFENILKSNGFNQIILHDVKDGYGIGSTFDVYECV
ncbi:class I SAM-dependent methyltransferase [Bacillus sp. Cr_A10]|uniref:class I SAM-dependent methyltransferase n=1 Tax=Bacillus sp. Cr_A10 TaxID=3033993 RepID=UPI0023DB9638|nr:class I SAM-dependent methyltransferase [Bacillus sp. Cr_A10]MDF2065586.1 class I SAM-dependent methyltransferase [Bacillus sp. Cr_A10]